MTKDQIKALYEAKITAEAALNNVRGNLESFDADFEYQTASLKYARAVNAYDDAVREFVDKQVAA